MILVTWLEWVSRSGLELHKLGYSTRCSEQCRTESIMSCWVASTLGLTFTGTASKILLFPPPFSLSCKVMFKIRQKSFTFISVVLVKKNRGKVISSHLHFCLFCNVFGFKHQIPFPQTFWIFFTNLFHTNSHPITSFYIFSLGMSPKDTVLEQCSSAKG